MGIVRLGKLVLRWCKSCNVPVIEAEHCGKCDGQTYPVMLTPPGDIRPAFEVDVQLIREAIDDQFGEGCGEAVIEEDKIILLNKAPALDRMDEVIMDGKVLCSLRYDVGEGYKALLRLDAAHKLTRFLKRGWVVVDQGAVEPIKKGASALAVGVLEAHSDIKMGDEVIVLSPEKEPIAIGKARMTGPDMLEKGKDSAVKTRWYGEGKASSLSKGQSWDDVIEANEWFFEKKIQKALEFIRRTVEEHMDKPVVVSFSGGKDSLATLLLLLDSGIKPRLLFINTGLEFKETEEHVREVAKRYDLDLVTENAGNSFWEDLDLFGPPGKDFRWCCKTCKLGPTTRLIQKHFPEGVLSFIGQRAYESEQRAKKGRIWKNPWVPGQVGASPIQDWTALHVWLYIFHKKAPYNVWYERGLERIGCWLCPATDMADFAIVEKHHLEYKGWKKALKNYADEYGFTKAWVENGLWRWKKLPKVMIELMEAQGLSVKKEGEQKGKGTYLFYSAEGYQPCEGGVSIEGVFDRALDLERVANQFNAIGEPEFDETAGVCSIKNADVFREGGVAVRGDDLKEAKKLMKKIKDIVLRSQLCVACGTCAGRCENQALHVEEHAWIDEEECLHCGECLGPCPVTGYVNKEFEF